MRKSETPRWGLWVAGVSFVFVAFTAACVDDAVNPAGSDAGVSGNGPPADGGAPATSDARADGPSDGASPGRADGGDRFAGVWRGVQQGATVEISNAAGCSHFQSSVDGTVCDTCDGTYVVGDGGSSATSVSTCTPRGACSVSPPHTNTGTFTLLASGALSFVYDYGGGTASVEAQPTSDPPGDVCRVVDAGVRD